MNILYILILGNMCVFVKYLVEYVEKMYVEDFVNFEVILKEIYENSDFMKEIELFFIFVFIYLDGGNGLDNGDIEILIEMMCEYLEYEDNYKFCFGVVGSGNKNFNN